MSQEGGGKQQNTAYGVFVQACWAQHKRQYPDEQIHKEIEEFNKQCSVWWYNLSDQERDRFQDMANRSNQAEGITEVNNKTQNNSSNQNNKNNVQGVQQGRAVNTNYVQNVHSAIKNQQMGGFQMNNQGKPSKPAKDPNAPKKPLSAYFLFTNDERQKIKEEFPNMSITEIAKETGRRWANISPDIREKYEARYQESRNQYDQDMANYNQSNSNPSRPQKKVKDPNAPKQPLSAYFLFQNQERDKIKQANPNFSICEVAKELGKRWSEMPQSEKQRYTQQAEEGRHKYDQDMAEYRGGGGANSNNSNGSAFAEKQGMELPLV